MTTQKDNQQGIGNELVNKLKDNADWQVGLVVMLALVVLAVKLFMSH